MATQRIPAISKALVEWLEATFRDRLPDSIDATDRQVWMATGAASVVRKLRTEYERQLNNVLE